MKIDSKLKSILDERGLSIRKVSADTGINFESLRRFYNNETERYSRDVLIKLCNYLNVDISDLIQLDRQE